MNRPVEILVVEDNPADAHLAKHALLDGPVPKSVNLVTDGVQAIDYIRRRGRFKDAPRPDLVLLDLNLPKRSGMEVLKEIKADPQLRSITVIVLTTSSYASDVNTAYELLANCYIVKPVDLDDFYAMMRAVEEFWMRLASLPTEGQDPRTTSAETEKEEKGGGTRAGARKHGHVRPPVRDSRTPARHSFWVGGAVAAVKR
jgi:two-component system, chemotaxis family, response regulator Rcp1